jgi:hypothetical protein
MSDSQSHKTESEQVVEKTIVAKTGRMLKRRGADIQDPNVSAKRRGLILVNVLLLVLAPPWIEKTTVTGYPEEEVKTRAELTGCDFRS